MYLKNRSNIYNFELIIVILVFIIAIILEVKREKEIKKNINSNYTKEKQKLVRKYIIDDKKKQQVIGIILLFVIFAAILSTFVDKINFKSSYSIILTCIPLIGLLIPIDFILFYINSATIKKYILTALFIKQKVKIF